MTSPEVAVVHKHFIDDGGAERVATELARTFEAPLYVGYSDPDAVDRTDVEVVNLFDSSLALLLARRSGLVRELYSLDAWEHQPELANYDVLIQTSPQPGWYVPTEDQRIIRYVHDLPRTVYDRFQFSDQTLTSRLFARIYRILHSTAAKFVDDWVVNSEYVQNRLEKYLNISDATVVNPPVDVSKYDPKPTDNFYLVYSRLSPRKRVHDVIAAFDSLPEQRLIVGGTGPLADRIQRQVADLPNVKYRGYLSEDVKIDLLGRAKAVIFGAETESFGMVPIEAFASGTPVIGAASGYTEFHIDDGENGILFDWDGQGVEGGVRRFETKGVNRNASALISESRQFDVTHFREQMTQLVGS